MIAVKQPDKDARGRIKLSANPFVASALWLARKKGDDRRWFFRRDEFSESWEPLAGFCNDWKFDADRCNDFARGFPLSRYALRHDESPLRNTTTVRNMEKSGSLVFFAALLVGALAFGTIIALVVFD